MLNYMGEYCDAFQAAAEILYNIESLAAVTVIILGAATPS